MSFVSVVLLFHLQMVLEVWIHSIVVLQHEDQNSAVSSFRDQRGLLSEVVEGSKETTQDDIQNSRNGEVFWILVMAYHLHP